MRRLNLLSLFVLLALLLSAGPGVVMAQEPPVADSAPTTPAPSPTASPNDVTDADLERFVDLVISEQITVAQARAFLQQLAELQVSRVAELLSARTSTRLAESSKVSPVSPNIIEPPPGSSELWRQIIEKGAGPPEAFAQDYWSDPYCEGGPNPDPDDDWVFWFWIDSTNPDSLRWDTTSAQVATAFWIAYGNNLNGFAYHWDEARLCLGTTGVSLAGGPEKVKNTTSLHH